VLKGLFSVAIEADEDGEMVEHVTWTKQQQVHTGSNNLWQETCYAITMLIVKL
jgi:hypothetical protein